MRLGDGRCGFVRGALPGDRVRPLRVTGKKGTLRALSWELIRPGPTRVEPPCPFERRCGGCNWMALPRSAELEYKATLLEEALWRTGRIRCDSTPVVHTAGLDLGYRNRLRIHVEPGGRVGLMAARSHELVPIPNCPVACSQVNDGIEVLRELLRVEPQVTVLCREVELRAAPAGPPLTLHFLPQRHTSGDELAALLARIETPWPLSVGKTAPAYQHAQGWPLPGGVELWAPPGAFTQVNWRVNTQLVKRVLTGVSERGIQSLLDLYCGAGNFTLPLGQAGVKVIGVDSATASIVLARKASLTAGLADVDFLAVPARFALAEFIRSGRRFDCLLLDPPRTGGREVLALAAEIAPEFLALCSCDPVTLARDLALLKARGFVLEELRAFDMFPHTHHLETLAWLRRPTPSLTLS